MNQISVQEGHNALTNSCQGLKDYHKQLLRKGSIHLWHILQFYIIRTLTL